MIVFTRRGSLIFSLPRPAGWWPFLDVRPRRVLAAGQRCGLIGACPELD